MQSNIVYILIIAVLDHVRTIWKDACQNQMNAINYIRLIKNLLLINSSSNIIIQNNTEEMHDY